MRAENASVGASAPATLDASGPAGTGFVTGAGACEVRCPAGTFAPFAAGGVDETVDAGRTAAGTAALGLGCSGRGCPAIGCPAAGGTCEGGTPGFPWDGTATTGGGAVDEAMGAFVDAGGTAGGVTAGAMGAGFSAKKLKSSSESFVDEAGAFVDAGAAGNGVAPGGGAMGGVAGAGASGGDEVGSSSAN